jgi:hypothetical protein
VNHTASYHFGATHPLSGLENWPKSGPVYGLGDEDDEHRAATFWERLGERFRKPPPGDSFNAGQARIWY